MLSRPRTPGQTLLRILAGLVLGALVLAAAFRGTMTIVRTSARAEAGSGQASRSRRTPPPPTFTVDPAVFAGHRGRRFRLERSGATGFDTSLPDQLLLSEAVVNDEWRKLVPDLRDEMISHGRWREVDGRIELEWGGSYESIVAELGQDAAGSWRGSAWLRTDYEPLEGHRAGPVLELTPLGSWPR